MSAAGNGAAAAVTAAGSVEGSVFCPPFVPMEQRAPFFEAFLNADGAEGFVDADIDVAGMGDIFEPQLQRVYPKPARGMLRLCSKRARARGWSSPRNAPETGVLVMTARPVYFMCG